MKFAKSRPKPRTREEIILFFVFVISLAFVAIMVKMQPTITPEIASLIFAFVILGTGVIMFLDGFRVYNEKKFIEAVPTTAIEGIAMGLTEIVGKVVRFPKEKLMTSPLSNKKCVYWRLVAQQLRSRGHGKRRRAEWVTLYDIRKGIRFYLKDKTGQVLVDPKGARVDLKPDVSLYGRPKIEVLFGLSAPKMRRIDSYLKSYTGYPKKRRPSFAGLYKIGSAAYKKKIGMVQRTGDKRYCEYVIGPKDRLYILGTAGDNPFVKETTALKAVKDVMIQKGELEKFYVISDKSEKEILGEYGIRVWFEILVGALLILAMTAWIGGQLL